MRARALNDALYDQLTSPSRIREHVAAYRTAREQAKQRLLRAQEELRQLLIEQLGQSYTQVKVEFKTLEDLDTIVNVAGANMAMARYILSVTFSPLSAEAAQALATPAPSRAPKQ